MIQPNDYIRLPEWPYCWPVIARKDGKVWLADARGGLWSYGETLKWCKETDDERDRRIERQRRGLD
ncbi:hypothetical protein EB231_34765 [Mesorhizobium sp. NZP2298]|nr:hypothetical protein EB231_34765 [Mesorhizobium sp. NZP2298]